MNDLTEIRVDFFKPSGEWHKMIFIETSILIRDAVAIRQLVITDNDFIHGMAFTIEAQNIGTLWRGKWLYPAEKLYEDE
jgi:hypothetical protein